MNNQNGSSEPVQAHVRVFSVNSSADGRIGTDHWWSYFGFLRQTPAISLHSAILLLNMGFNLLVLSPLLFSPGHHINSWCSVEQRSSLLNNYDIYIVVSLLKMIHSSHEQLKQCNIYHFSTTLSVSECVSTFIFIVLLTWGWAHMAIQN